MTQPIAQLLALADFNDARLNEDYEAARLVLGVNVIAGIRRGIPAPRWSYQEDGSIRDAGDEGTPRVKFTWLREAEHIVRHDPARTLREVAAKRLLIANWRKLIRQIDAEHDPDMRERLALTRHGLDQVAFQLAAVHDQHPDYQEAWRP